MRFIRRAHHTETELAKLRERVRELEEKHELLPLTKIYIHDYSKEDSVCLKRAREAWVDGLKDNSPRYQVYCQMNIDAIDKELAKRKDSND